MITVVSIDPGNDWGAALFVGGTLRAAHLRSFPMTAPDVVVIERPEIYPRMKVPPGDIVALALNAGWLDGQIAALETVWVTPKHWKGQVPKHIMYKRIMAALSDAELTALTSWLARLPKGSAHNVVDAVGIGLWYHQRIG